MEFKTIAAAEEAKKRATALFKNAEVGTTEFNEAKATVDAATSAIKQLKTTAMSIPAGSTTAVGAEVTGLGWCVLHEKDLGIYDDRLLEWLTIENGFFVDDRTKQLVKFDKGIVRVIGDDKEGRGVIKRFIRHAALIYDGERRELLRFHIERKLNGGLISGEFMIGFPSRDLVFTRDTATTIYWPFKDCKVVVTKDGATRMDYEEGDCFMYERIPKRGHIPEGEPQTYEELRDRPSEFERFLRNITIKKDSVDETMYHIFRTNIGYILSGYKAGSPPALLVQDAPRTGEDNGDEVGGTGKSLLIKLLVGCTYGVSKGGKRLDLSNAFALDFLRPGMRLVGFQDMKKSFNFEEMYDLITDGADYSQKFKNSVHLSENDTPKIAMSLNHALRGQTGSHAERRQLVLEILEHYNEANPVDKEFGHKFPDGWNDDEYNRFYTFMIDCCVYYLNTGIKKPNLSMDAKKRRLVNATCEEFVDFMDRRIMEHNRGTSQSRTGLRVDQAFEHYHRDIEKIPQVRDWAKKVDQARFKVWCRTYVKHYQNEWGDLSVDGAVSGIKMSHSKKRETIQLIVSRDIEKVHRSEFEDEVFPDTHTLIPQSDMLTTASSLDNLAKINNSYL